MAYRELGMVEVREILRRWLDGEGVRAMARAVGMGCKTIAAYIEAAAVAVGVQRGGAPPTDEQITRIASVRRLKAGRRTPAPPARNANSFPRMSRAPVSGWGKACG